MKENSPAAQLALHSPLPSTDLKVFHEAHRVASLDTEKLRQGAERQKLLHSSHALNHYS